jgi:hypothetical protein
MRTGRILAVCAALLVATAATYCAVQHFRNSASLAIDYRGARDRLLEWIGLRDPTG